MNQVSSLRAQAWSKYTTPFPSIGLSESDLELYINFEFCEEKNHKILKITLIYKAEQFMLTNSFSRKVYIISKMVQVVCK